MEESVKLATDSTNRARETLDSDAVRVNVILWSMLSLKHMRYSYSSQAIEEKKKGKIQGQLLPFNDFIFILNGCFSQRTRSTSLLEIHSGKAMAT